jgi:uncharacterized protein YegP (UPF0339 family)
MAGGYAAVLPPGSGLRPAAAAAADEKPGRKATFEVYQDKAGEYRWRMRSSNGQVIASSGQGYKEKRSCLDGIESVKRHAADAAVEEKKGEE